MNRIKIKYFMEELVEKKKRKGRSAREGTKRILKSRARCEINALRTFIENPLDDLTTIARKAGLSVNTVKSALDKLSTGDYRFQCMEQVMKKDIIAQDLAASEIIDRLANKKERKGMSVSDLVKIGEAGFKRSQVIDGKPTELVGHGIQLTEEQKALMAERYARTTVLEVNNQEEEGVE